jgi:hypothetical protein
MRTPISVVRCVTMNESTPKSPTAASTSESTAKAESKVASKLVSRAARPMISFMVMM